MNNESLSSLIIHYKNCSHLTISLSSFWKNEDSAVFGIEDDAWVAFGRDRSVTSSAFRDTIGVISFLL